MSGEQPPTPIQPYPRIFKVTTPAPGDQQIAKFTARQVGVSRVEAASADGRYTFQLRVDVGPPPT